MNYQSELYLLCHASALFLALLLGASTFLHRHTLLLDFQCTGSALSLTITEFSNIKKKIQLNSVMDYEIYLCLLQGAHVFLAFFVVCFGGFGFAFAQFLFCALLLLNQS
jgi:hypothetical protein